MCYSSGALRSPAIDALLFDAGGTLVHLDYAFIAEVARDAGARIDESALPHGDAAARQGIDARSQRAGEMKGTDETRRSDYFSDMLRVAGVAEAHIEPVCDALDRHHRRRNLWRVPLEGAAETLRALRERGVRTGVVSNADGTIESVMTRAGLVEHLEVVVDSHCEGVEKPDPEIFRRAVSRLDVAAERCVYIGDIYSIDAVGARAAGLAPVIIDPTGAYGEIDCPVIRGLSELLTLPQVFDPA